MKKIIKLFMLIVTVTMLTGCLKSEELDNAEIFTTVYPIEYLVNELYGYNSEVKSIYPDGVDVKEYTLSNTKKKKYAKSDLFIYNGLTDEKKVAANFLTHNSRLKIIDVSEGLAIKYNYEELWLNPSNFLMLAQNIKNGLNSYIESTIIKEQIETNYNNLKVQLTEFETTLKLLSQNGTYTTLIVSKDYFKYLENYGFEIISLEETEDLSNDTINSAKKLIEEGKNKYVFVSSDEAKEAKYSDTIEKLKEAGAEVLILNTMTTLTSEQREINDTYENLMKANIELLKEEIFK